RSWSASARKIRPSLSTSKDDGPSVALSRPTSKPARPGPLPHGKNSAVRPARALPNGMDGARTRGSFVVTKKRRGGSPLEGRLATRPRGPVARSEKLTVPLPSFPGARDAGAERSNSSDGAAEAVVARHAPAFPDRVR